MPGNVAQAPFQCNIPRVALGSPSRIALYGHGLLGDHTQIEEINIQNMSAEHDFTFCATDWAGMSSADIPNAIQILQDFSKFPSLADRLQQGIVNTLYLGRLLAHPQGFTANAAFQGAGGAAARHLELYFDSNSQGAILGGLATAVAPDWRRAVLGVADDELRHAAAALGGLRHLQHHLQAGLPGRRRAPADPRSFQMLWDRGETNGWAYHVTSGRRATPRSTRCSSTWRWATTRWRT